jgi:predicted GNAT family acetyltransferase
MTDAKTSDPQIVILDNPSESRFEAHVDGHVGFVTYLKHGNTILFMHTEVPKELQGRGVASALARGVLDRARAEGWTVIARCPFIARYIERHPEYQSLLRPD